jgi:hypothetical protein
MHALRRYWWLVAIGVVVAVLAAVESVDSVGLGVPPKLKPRTKPSYTATAQFLVGDPTEYLRTLDTITTPQPKRVQLVHEHLSNGATKTISKLVPVSPIVSVRPPDFKTLATVANTYPQIVEGTAVALRRTALLRAHGIDHPVNGKVSAKTVGSQQSANKFRASPLPIVEIDATANKAKTAMLLANTTFQAFQQWLTTTQQNATPPVPKSQRIEISSLQSADKAVSSSSGSKSLGIVVFAVVLAAFVVLAILLDRLRRTPEEPQRPLADDDWTTAADEELLQRERARRYARSGSPAATPHDPTLD